MFQNWSSRAQISQLRAWKNGFKVQKLNWSRASGPSPEIEVEQRAKQLQMKDMALSYDNNSISFGLRKDCVESNDECPRKIYWVYSKLMSPMQRLLFRKNLNECE
jgi:hypothetical protein